MTKLSSRVRIQMSPGVGCGRPPAKVASVALGVCWPWEFVPAGASEAESLMFSNAMTNAITKGGELSEGRQIMAVAPTSDSSPPFVIAFVMAFENINDSASPMHPHTSGRQMPRLLSARNKRRSARCGRE